MSDETGYNGWTNYETWCMALWLDNDESSYDRVREMVAELDENSQDNSEIRSDLASWLRDFAQDLAEEAVPGLFATGNFVLDFFNAAMTEVDWYEIATNKMIEFAPAEVE